MNTEPENLDLSKQPEELIAKQIKYKELIYAISELNPLLAKQLLDRSLENAVEILEILIGGDSIESNIKNAELDYAISKLKHPITYNSSVYELRKVLALSRIHPNVQSRIMNTLTRYNKGINTIRDVIAALNNENIAFGKMTKKILIDILSALKLYTNKIEELPPAHEIKLESNLPLEVLFNVAKEFYPPLRTELASRYPTIGDFTNNLTAAVSYLDKSRVKHISIEYMRAWLINEGLMQADENYDPEYLNKFENKTVSELINQIGKEVNADQRDIAQVIFKLKQDGYFQIFQILKAIRETNYQKKLFYKKLEETFPHTLESRIMNNVMQYLESALNEG